jgi:hypothetical protein
MMAAAGKAVRSAYRMPLRCYNAAQTIRFRLGAACMTGKVRLSSILQATALGLCRGLRHAMEKSTFETLRMLGCLHPWKTNERVEQGRKEEEERT